MSEEDYEFTSIKPELIEELIDVCLGAYKQENTQWYQFMKNVPIEEQKQYMRNMFQNPKIQATSVVALKDGQIVSFFGGQDLTFLLKGPYDETLRYEFRAWRHLMRTVYQPMIDLNAGYGVCMTGLLFCVRVGFRGKAIGKFISARYMQLQAENGYQVAAGQFSSLKSAKLILQFGSEIWNEVDIDQLEFEGKYPFKNISEGFGSYNYLIGNSSENYPIKSVVPRAKL